MPTYNLKIAALIASLSEKEAKDVCAFLKDDEKMLAHFEVWLTFLKTVQQDNYRIDAAVAWRNLYKETEFDRKQYDYDNADLVTRIEHFLLLQSHKTKLFETEIAVFAIYEARGITEYRHFEKSINNAQTKIETQVCKSLEHATQNWLLEARLERFTASENVSIPENNADCAARRLYELFISQKLRYLCDAQTSRNIRKKTIDIQGEAEFIAWLNSDENLRKNPLTNAYYMVHKMLTTTDRTEADACFEYLLAFVKTEKANVGRLEHHELCTYTLNYVIKGINTNEENVWQQAFKVYTDFFETGVLEKNDKILTNNLNNAIKAILRIEGTAEADAFLKKHSNKLPTDTAEHDIQYLKAIIYLQAKEYAEAIDVLPKDNGYDPFYPLNWRILHLKISFFTQKIDDFEKTMTNFTKFLDTNTNGYHESRLARSKKIITYTKKIHKIKINRVYLKTKKIAQNEKLEKLRTKIEQEPDLIDKMWLYEQIDALKY